MNRKVFGCGAWVTSMTHGKYKSIYEYVSITSARKKSPIKNATMTKIAAPRQERKYGYSFQKSLLK
jgi:hypothetical protein